MNMKNKNLCNKVVIQKGITILSTFFIALLLISFVSAGLGTFKSCEPIDIKTILNTSSVTLSTLSYPNGSLATSNIAMQNIAGLTWNYTFSDTCALGTYNYDYYDANNNVYVNDFEVTPNGNAPPSGIVIVLFVILFLIVIASMTTLLFLTIGYFRELSVDIKDVAYNFSAYFALFALYILGIQYMGNSFIDDFLLWIIGIGSFTNILLPLIAFICSITIGRLNRKEYD